MKFERLRIRLIPASSNMTRLSRQNAEAIKAVMVEQDSQNSKKISSIYWAPPKRRYFTMPLKNVSPL